LKLKQDLSLRTNFESVERPDIGSNNYARGLVGSLDTIRQGIIPLSSRGVCFVVNWFVYTNRVFIEKISTSNVNERQYRNESRKNDYLFQIATIKE